MDRRDRILQHCTQAQLGIEVGPWFNPIAPKSKGYRCLSLDVFDASVLRSRAEADPNIPREKISDIEDVDLVGSSVDLGRLVCEAGYAGKVDYIVSSHNLEHIPDPIRFLQGCQEALKPHGIVSMAVPDKRTCFDHFRPYTTLGDWLEAFFERRSKPTLRQVFESASLGCLHNGSGVLSLGTDSSELQPTHHLMMGYDNWQAQLVASHRDYIDAHCWTLTPAVIELILRDLAWLRLLQFEVDEIAGPLGCEFFVRLRYMGKDWQPHFTQEAYFSMRTALLQRIMDEQAENSPLLAKTRRAMDTLHAALLEKPASEAVTRPRIRGVGRLRRIVAPLRRAATALLPPRT
ncbi:methyltransferase family protein [Paraburkholderia unamae]|uniref:class I SAM-dependent methyltransferase n=1 Tax=Paraburkholderia unamae TaxID=219649 RepID=UPI000DC49808|nr:methyltransferase domain-containing protein [Paraburkholderia unamae]RAR60628.1 methyltransferase family protein [Paraburkholderia unamae]